ncbi:hypothetical protein GcM1_239054 [Golovinomyces cichoracearum]|uniref:Duf1687 domain containing protein n=1 Tax=Golovinomyces cichoracearum TaxID=62708 RepID=A0A420IIW7_9PEZI|nr:hypothetical protein GcM1_239054 [Golovinomyces cichoracearum]
MSLFHKTLDVITLFHKASSPASRNVYAILKRASEKSCSASSQSSRVPRGQFELEITEELPTRYQLKSILEYAGAPNTSKIVKSAKDEKEAWKMIEASPENFQRPLIVDWARGRVTSQTNESDILKTIYSEHKT